MHCYSNESRRLPQNYLLNKKKYRNNVPPIQIKRINRIISAIHIRTDTVILLAQRIHGSPHSQCPVVVPCAIVEPVQAQHAVQLLAVVLIPLHITARRFCHQAAVGIVVVHLLHLPAGVGHHTVVPQMVLQVEMIHRLVAAVECNISTLYENRLQRAVLVDAGAAIVDDS